MSSCCMKQLPVSLVFSLKFIYLNMKGPNKHIKHYKNLVRNSTCVVVLTLWVRNIQHPEQLWPKNNNGARKDVHKKEIILILILLSLGEWLKGIQLSNGMKFEGHLNMRLKLSSIQITIWIPDWKSIGLIHQVMDAIWIPD